MAWEDDVGTEDEADGPIHIYPVYPDEPKHILTGLSCWCKPQSRGFGTNTRWIVVHARTQ